MYSLKDKSDKPVYNFAKVFDAPICDLQLSNSGIHVAVTSKEGYNIKIIDIRNNQVLMDLSDTGYCNSHDYNKCTFGPND